MNTEFTTYRVKEGKEKQALEWMKILQDRRDDCIETLAREKMGYESVFKIMIDGRLFLSWFSVQGEGADAVEGSEHEIDMIHCRFHQECIDPNFEPYDHEHVVSFSVPEVERAVSAITGGEMPLT